MKNLDTATVSIVLVGTFQPDMMDLPVLTTGKIIGADEAAATKYLMLVKGQAVELALPWGRLQTLKELLVIDALQAPYIRAADLALRCTRELDPTCRVTMMGINLRAILKFQTMADRDAFGQRLLPPSGWGKWGTRVADSISKPKPENPHGGMTLSVLRSMKNDEDGGWVDARVEPLFVDDGTWRAVVTINDHYPTPTPNEGERAARIGEDRYSTEILLTTLEKSFDESVQSSFRIVESIESGA